MANLGYATIQVIPSMQGAAGVLSQGLGGPAAAAGAQAGRVAGGAMAGGISSALTSAGAVLTVGATAPFVGIVNVAADFESAMYRVSAITQASAVDMGRLQEAAISAGAASIFTATESANALYELGAAGFSVQESIDALPGVLQLASAGQLQIADAAVIASQVLHGFGLEVDDLGRVNDVLAQASVDSTASVASLGTAFTYVGPLAALAGTSFEETAAALAILSNNGFDGTLAGTALRGVIESLINPTNAQAERLQELGIQVTDATGKMFPLASIIAQFAQSGASAADIMAIFGQRAGPAFAALLQEGTDALVDEQRALLNAEGAAQTMSDTMLQGLNPALERIQGAFQSLAIAIAQAGVLDMLTGLANRLADVIAVAVTLPRPVLAVVGVVGALAAAAGPLLLVSGLLVRQWSVLRPALTVLASAITGISAPVLIAVAAVVALASSFYLAYRRSAEMRDNLARIADVVGPPLQALGGIVRDSLGSLFDLLGGEGNSVLAQFLDLNARVWVSVTDFIADFAERVGGVASAFSGWVSEFGGISAVAMAIGEIFQLDPEGVGRVRGALQGIVDVSVALRDVAVGAFESFIGAVSGPATTAADAIAGIGARAFDWGTGEGARNALEGVRDVASATFGWLADNVPPVLERIRDISLEVWGWLAANVPPALVAVRDAAVTSFGWLEEHVPPVLVAIRDGAVTSFGWLRDNVPPALAAVRDAAVSSFGWINDNVVPVFDAILRGGVRLVDWFREHWREIATIVVGTFAPVLGAIVLAVTQFGSVREAAGSALGGLLEVVGAVVDGIRPIISDFVTWWRENWDNIRGTIERIMTVVAVFRGAIVAAFTGLIVAVSAVWNRFGDTIIDAVVDTIDYVMRSLRNVFRVIEGIVGAFLALINGDWSGVWRNLGLIVTAVWDQIGATVRLGWERIKTLLSLGLDALGALWDVAWGGMKAAVGLAIDALIFQLVELPSRITGAVGDLGGLLAGQGTALIGGLASSAQGATTDTLLPFIGGLPDVIGGALDTTRTFVGKGVDLMTGFYRGVIDFHTNTLIPWLLDLPRNLVSFHLYLGDLFTSKGNDLMSGLYHGALGFFTGTLLPWLTGLPAQAAGTLTDLDIRLVPKGRALLRGLWDGAQAVAEDMLAWAARLPGSLADAIAGALGALVDIGREMVHAIARGIRSVAGEIADALQDAVPGGGLLGRAADAAGGLIGRNARGTSSWGGGLTLVGEEGPELVNMPRGSEVTPHQRTEQLFASGGGGGTSVRVFIGQRELTDIVRVEVDEHTRAEQQAVGAGVRW